MSTKPVCPCDAANPNPIANLPGLSQIVFRAGDFNFFRRALLTPLLNDSGQPVEVSLPAWQSGVGADPSVVDLAVMMAEWWAYLSDILTFYNERIANEDYLRTAYLPETPAELIRLLGYRPRPIIGAEGTLAALVAKSILPGQTVILPKGLQFQSKPGPGGAPQTFELAQATAIGLPDQVPAVTPPLLIAQTTIEISELYRIFARGEAQRMSAIFRGPTHPRPISFRQLTAYQVLLKGTVTSVSNGNLLLLGPRDDTNAPTLITVAEPPLVQTVAGGGKQTQITFVADPAPDLTMTSSNARLMKAGVSSPLWSVNGNAINGAYIHLAGVARQIRPLDWVVFNAPTLDDAMVTQVQTVQDVFGDAQPGGGPGPTTSFNKTSIPILHTMLTVSPSLDSTLTGNPTAVSVLSDWVEVGSLIDQPPALWDGVSSLLQAVEPAQFASGPAEPVLFEDSNGVGEEAQSAIFGESPSGDPGLVVSWPTSTTVPFKPGLQPPITVYYNLLPVTCGKTVAGEVLGSGDATIAGQSFKLAKSPVTYLMVETAPASTVSITVDNLPWKEVDSFYNQPANAQVFVTRQDSDQNTWVDFGDGVNGARLTTGSNNVVATYRIGGGAASPPAGKLTVISQSYPGLRSIVNPVAVAGGADPDPAALIKEYAPRSVLTFGRAVSVFDYQALAAQAPGVTMASATWSWDDTNLRGSVTVYVAGQPNVSASVRTLLSAAGDPNRPVTVSMATPITVTLTMTFVMPAGANSDAILAEVQTALCDPIAGLFSPTNLGIGQSLFNSDIEAACLKVAGVSGISSLQFAMNGAVDPGSLHSPGEGNYFSLVPAGLIPTVEAGGDD